MRSRPGERVDLGGSPLRPSRVGNLSGLGNVGAGWGRGMRLIVVHSSAMETKAQAAKETVRVEHDATRLDRAIRQWGRWTFGCAADAPGGITQLACRGIPDGPESRSHRSGAPTAELFYFSI